MYSEIAILEQLFQTWEEFESKAKSNNLNMGVATPWPKGAMAPPIICEKKFFLHFLAYFMF